MDVNAIIVGAMMAGLNEVSKATAGQAVKDGYQSLKDLILKKIQKKPGTEKAHGSENPVDRFEKAPKANEQYMIDQLSQAKIKTDGPIHQAAEALLKIVDKHSQKADVSQETNVSGSVGSVLNIGTVEKGLYIGTKYTKD